jgi:hypothetical protein
VLETSLELNLKAKYNADLPVIDEPEQDEIMVE